MKLYVLEYRATLLVVGKRPKRSKIYIHVPAHRLEQEKGGVIVGEQSVFAHAE